jgi:hypothetical protein
MRVCGRDAGVNCAGTLDMVGVLRGVECVIDWKSGQVPRTVGPQTAAYERFYRGKRGGRIRRRYCVQLCDTGDYRLHPLKDPADWSYFLSALNIHHWRQKNAAA